MKQFIIQISLFRIKILLNALSKDVKKIMDIISFYDEIIILYMKSFLKSLNKQHILLLERNAMLYDCFQNLD